MADATRGVVSVLRRDFRIFLSYRLRPFAVALAPLATLAIFFFIAKLVRVGRFDQPADYFGYVVVGLVILQVVTATLTGPQTALRHDLAVGAFERVVASPLGAVGGMVGYLLFPVAQAVVVAALTLGYAVVIFGLELPWSSLLTVPPLALLGILAFAPVGIVLQAGTLLVKQAAAATGWLLAGIALVSGVYFPIELLPDGLRWLADVQPFTPAIDLLREALLDTPLRHGFAGSLARVAGFAVVALPLAVAVLGLAVARARRTGSIVEV